MIVLTSTNAGRVSKNVHSFFELLKCQTLIRLLVSNTGCNAMTELIRGGVVGVGVGVGGLINGSVTVTEVKALTLPTVTLNV